MKKLVEVLLGDLKPFPENPKDITPEERKKLKNGIEKHGILKSQSVWKGPDGYIVLDGNQRLDVYLEVYGKAAKVPCELVECKDWPDAHEKCLMLLGTAGDINKAKLKKMGSECGYDSLESMQEVFSFVETRSKGVSASDEEEGTGDGSGADTEDWEKLVHVECPKCSTQFPQKNHKCKPSEVDKSKFWKENE